VKSSVDIGLYTSHNINVNCGEHLYVLRQTKLQHMNHNHIIIHNWLDVSLLWLSQLSFDRYAVSGRCSSYQPSVSSSRGCPVPQSYVVTAPPTFPVLERSRSWTESRDMTFSRILSAEEFLAVSGFIK